MKKYIALLVMLAVLCSGCTGISVISTEPISIPTTTPTEQTTPPTTEAALTQEDMCAVALPAVEETVTDEDGKVLFTSTSQSMSLVVPDPDVADKIIIDFLTRQDDLQTAAQSLKSSAQTNIGDAPYFHNALFNPQRIDQNVLSLSGNVISWSGGAHPSYNCLFANYDMVTGDVLTLGSILTHKEQAAPLGELVIEAIGEIQLERSIWDGYEETIRDRFSGDVSYDQSWFFNHIGLCFSFPPYEIAPYSSGVITVTVPYEKLTGIIEDAFFPVEHGNTSASLLAEVLSDANTNRFSQIAEIVLDEDGSMILLHSDKAVYDVTLTVDNNYVAFAAASVTPGDAIMVQTDLSQQALTLHYHSGDQIISHSICDQDGMIVLQEDPS